MDNAQVDITLEGRKNFDLAMQIGFTKHTATGFQISQEKGFILFWTNHDSATPFPYPMNWQQAADFVWGWLEQYKMGRAPDLDGDTGKAFRVYSESWGHVDGKWQAFLAIQPIWALYGK